MNNNFDYEKEYQAWKEKILSKSKEEIYNFSYLISLENELFYYFENTEDWIETDFNFSDCFNLLGEWYNITFSTIKIGSLEDNEEWIEEFMEKMLPRTDI